MAPWLSYKTGISEIVIGEGITDIGSYAFYGMSNLTKLSLPASLRKIGFYSFTLATKLDEINLPDKLEVIGAGAFYSAAIEDIVIPKTVTYIGESAFYSTKYYNELKDTFVIVGDGILLKYNGESSELAIPKGVKGIYSEAFSGNSNLTKVSIPEGVEWIDDNVFRYCSALVNVSLPSTLKMVGNDAFYGTPYLDSIRAENGLIIINGNIVYKYEGKDKSVTFPKGIISISPYAFRDSTITDLYLNEELKTIGKFAFSKYPDNTETSLFN